MDFLLPNKSKRKRSSRSYTVASTQINQNINAENKKIFRNSSQIWSVKRKRQSRRLHTIKENQKLNLKENGL